MLRGLSEPRTSLLGDILDVVARRAKRARRTTVTDPLLPAWSEPFSNSADRVRRMRLRAHRYGRAWGDSTGISVRVGSLTAASSAIIRALRTRRGERRGRDR